LKCPVCANELRKSQKDPAYALCDPCKKKFRISSVAKPQNQIPQDQTPDTSYSNIPSRETREKGERRIRQEYEAMLALDDSKDSSKRGGSKILKFVIVLVLLVGIGLALVWLNGHFQILDMLDIL